MRFITTYPIVASTVLVMVLGGPAWGSEAADEQSRTPRLSDKVSMQQLVPASPPPAGDESSDLTDIRNQAGDAQAVSQLPDDIEVADDDAAPELEISKETETASAMSPERRLYQEVAQVWRTIRSQGLQPTPELIAREIGPDALSAFLNQNPDASGIFGQDSDELPLENPDLGGLELPDGAIVVLPPGTDG